MLRSLGIINPTRREVAHNGYGLDERGEVGIYLVFPSNGFAPDSIEKAVRENVRFLAQGIVVSTRELYTRGISGSQKYETVVE